MSTLTSVNMGGLIRDSAAQQADTSQVAELDDGDHAAAAGLTAGTDCLPGLAGVMGGAWGGQDQNAEADAEYEDFTVQRFVALLSGESDT